MKYYHVTALPNVSGILANGLRIDQRGANPYGLDTGLDYDEAYDSTGEGAQHEKPNVIHLAKDPDIVEFYKNMVFSAFNVTPVVLVVEVDESIHPITIDSEDRQAYCCSVDIDPRYISEMPSHQYSFFSHSGQTERFGSPRPGSSILTTDDDVSEEASSERSDDYAGDDDVEESVNMQFPADEVVSESESGDELSSSDDESDEFDEPASASTNKRKRKRKSGDSDAPENSDSDASVSSRNKRIK